MPAFLTAAIAWFVRSVLVKFLIMFALYFVVSEFVPELIKLLPTETNLPDLFSALPDSVWYFINYFKVVTGINLVIAAMLTRFLIRRIPLIG